MEEEIIIVNEKDEAIGYGTKKEVHQTGKLHRAFSVFLYNKNRLLIQKRASDKYHSPGLWANTCCSHPRRGELLEHAVDRRLMEEAGIRCSVKEVFSFIYKYKFDENLYEYEFDHVFLGEYDGEYIRNPEEAEEFAWVDIDELEKDLKCSPDRYACWFQIAAPRIIEILRK